MYQSPRGTQDIVPEDAVVWRYVERQAAETARRFAYGEIRTPTFEDASLFLRGVGAGTDIVDKEIYRFQDKGGSDLALRPEGTASVVRAYLQHGMASRPQPVKLYSLLTVFRYDRPQAGRYREFRQFNVEAIGEEDPLADVEVIAVLWRFLEGLGLRDLTVLLNSIGDPICRPEYIRALRAYYEPHRDRICADDRRRLETNPLRLLDCKQAGCQPIVAGAPNITDYLCDACRQHFERLKSYLDAMEIPFELAPRLVRGLDYYTRTVFEVVPPKIGAQATIGGGGRYDGLAELLGGKHTPGVGFAAGMDRIIMNLRQQCAPLPEAEAPRVFIAPVGRDVVGDEAKRRAIALADQLRARDVATQVGMGDRSMKARLRQADASGARLAVIIGEEELREGQATVKDLQNAEQGRIGFDRLVDYLADTPAAEAVAP
ncbi:MAG: histidine--tRNA ligase [Chloroflexota bacterium]|nr:histidine--tRNA ligase [Chloroflexota bacterium]